MGFPDVGLNHSILLASSPSSSPKLAATADTTGEHSLVLLPTLIRLELLSQTPRLRLLEEGTEHDGLERRSRAKLHCAGTVHVWSLDIWIAAIPAAASLRALHTSDRSPRTLAKVLITPSLQQSSMKNAQQP